MPRRLPVLHKPIFKCFIHTLRDVNPELAAELESVAPMPAPVKSKGVPVKLGGAYRLRSRRLPGETALVNIWSSRVRREKDPSAKDWSNDLKIEIVGYRIEGTSNKYTLNPLTYNSYP